MQPTLAALADDLASGRTTARALVEGFSTPRRSFEEDIVSTSSSHH